MAQQQTNNADNHVTPRQLNDKTKSHLANPVFHDFFGGGTKPPQNDSAIVLGPNSPSSSSARGPISTASDLASERRAAGNHLEGIPFYGPRSDISGQDMSNKIAGCKRSNSDNTFIGPESLESSQLMKLLRNSSGGDRLLRRSIDDDATYVSQQMRPNSSASLIFQPPRSSGISKMDRMIPMNAGPPRGGGHFVPFVPHHLLPNRFREGNASPSNIISQSAADEGSRTGIKGHGVLSSHNNASGNGNGNGSERKASESSSLPSGSRQKGMTVNVEPESSTPSGSQHGFGASRQMTIFYGGQAHVFDDVHPNKADVIMALAGSNGGSWSTTFSPKSTAKLAAEAHLPGGESDSRGRLCIPGTSTQGLGFGDRVSIPAGGHQVSSATKDMRNSVQVAEPVSKDKNELL